MCVVLFPAVQSRHQVLRTIDFYGVHREGFKTQIGQLADSGDKDCNWPGNPSTMHEPVSWVP